MKKLLILLPLLLCGALGAESREELAEKYLLAKRTPEMMESAINSALENQLKGKPELMPYRGIFLAYFRKSLSYETHREMLIASYAKKFSAGELTELVRFAQSPLGQKIAGFETELGAEISRLNSRKLEENLFWLQQQLEKMTSGGGNNVGKEM